MQFNKRYTKESSQIHFLTKEKERKKGKKEKERKRKKKRKEEQPMLNRSKLYHMGRNFFIITKV